MGGDFTPAYRGGTGEPLVLLHGFTDTWRTWELVLPELERHHDVLAVTLAGHAGGPAFNGSLTIDTLPDAIERAMDEAGFETAHVVGNSLGGYMALKVGERGRARSVVALAPAGGWVDESFTERGQYFVAMQDQVKAVVQHADAIVSSPEGRRRATMFTTENYEHIPAELLAHQIRGVAECEVRALVELASNEGYSLDVERISCPVRVVWGVEDKLLEWPSAAVRYKAELPNADWVELDGIGHCPQLDVPLETAQLILDFTG